MKDSNELRDALRIAVPVEPEEKVAERRAALLSVIEREIYATPRRVEQEQKRRFWRRSGRILGVAAALLGTLGLGMLVSEFEGSPSTDAGANLGAPSSHESHKSARKTEPHRSLAGQSYETGAGHEKVLLMAGDTQVTMAAHTRVLVERDSENQQHLRLSSGGILLSVPKHRKGRSVEVQTSHATVQVTGTIFGVEVGRFSQAAGSPTQTRVSVERGQVIVQHSTGRVVLEAGDTWLSPPEPSSSASRSSVLPAPERSTLTANADRAGADSLKTPGRAAALDSRASESKVDPKSSAARASTEQAPRATARRAADSAALPALVPERARPAATAPQEFETASTLETQNNLLEKALAAEKQGDRERAAELIERFLQRYPRSPLRASALAIKKRLN